ncbi:MAG: hypothetical protein M1819_003174 [Sarea resinae]|nr:MAG: hypothetical protein M1819_003174 [Sarea resinae]
MGGIFSRESTASREPIRIVNCSGHPYEIGFQHGKEAAQHIHRSLLFYKALFKKTSNLEWPAVCETALRFLPLLKQGWQHSLLIAIVTKGVAEGAGVDFESILALNVRTEIAYGMATDGCTVLSWKAGEASFLAQNWDWQHEQKENLICLKIQQQGKPITIHMITEAGIIGKIGLNSAGVGVTLNAIKAHGVDYSRLPVHLALRTVLESSSVKEAMGRLKESGVASACHITVADCEGGLGLECSSADIVPLEMTDGKTTHTNHYLASHGDIQDIMYLPDTVFRLQRIRELVRDAEQSNAEPSTERISTLFKDEKNYPASICRAEANGSTEATLFNIVMDLKNKKATVAIGRPTQADETLLLNPISQTTDAAQVDA